MPEFERQYWDSTLFLSYVANNQPDFCDAIDALLRIRETGGISIVVSTFAIAEVRYLGGDDGKEVEPISPEERERRIETVREMFDSPELELRALTPHTAQLAQSIGNEHPALTPADCVHIATALDARCEILFTLDGIGARRRPKDMLRYSRQIGNPPLPITPPFEVQGYMFDLPKIAAFEQRYWEG